MQPYQIQIVINGKKADYNGTDIVLNYEAPPIGGVQFGGGFSQLFRLPQTGTNAEIFGFAHHLQAQTQAPYQELPTRILINEISVFGNAVGYLQEVTETEFLFFVVQKEKQVYQPVENKHLGDFFKEGNSDRNPTELNKLRAVEFPIFGANFVYPFSDFGGEVRPYNIAHQVGAVRLPYLWNAVSPQGLRCSLFENATPLTDWALSLKSGSGIIYKRTAKEDGNFFKTGQMVGEDTFELPMNYQALTTSEIHIKGEIIAPIMRREFQSYFIIRKNNETIFEEGFKKSFRIKIDVKTIVKPNDEISFELWDYELLKSYEAFERANDYEESRLSDEHQKYKAYYEEILKDDNFLDPTSFIEIRQKSTETISEILPQIKALDFLKELSGWFALTPLKIGGKFYFKTLNERLNAPVLDWSDRLIKRQKIKFAHSGFAQKNEFAYKPTETQQKAEISFENIQLPPQKKTESKFFFSGWAEAFPYFTAEKKEKERHIFTEYKPHHDRHFLLKLTQNHEPLDWVYKEAEDERTDEERTLKKGTTTDPIKAQGVPPTEIVNLYQTDLKRLFDGTKIVTAQMRLYLTDIVQFNFFTRIYVEALGGYFLPLRIKYSRYVSEVELWQIRPADIVTPLYEEDN